VRLDLQQNQLNVHAQEFTMNNLPRGMALYNASGNIIQSSKSNSNVHQQIQMAQQQQHNRQIMQQLQQQRIMMAHGHPMQMTLHQSSHLPLVNSPSSGNILHV
jgi:hypothetical protein